MLTFVKINRQARSRLYRTDLAGMNERIRHVYIDVSGCYRAVKW
jgi:hypothetical protein